MGTGNDCVSVSAVAFVFITKFLLKVETVSSEYHSSDKTQAKGLKSLFEVKSLGGGCFYLFFPHGNAERPRSGSPALPASLYSPP
jgi:hypothetical protein